MQQDSSDAKNTGHPSATRGLLVRFAQLELAAIGAKFKKRPGVTHHKAKEAIVHMVQKTYSIRKKKF